MCSKLICYPLEINLENYLSLNKVFDSNKEIINKILSRLFFAFMTNKTIYWIHYVFSDVEPESFDWLDHSYSESPLGPNTATLEN